MPVACPMRRSTEGTGRSLTGTVIWPPTCARTGPSVAVYVFLSNESPEHPGADLDRRSSYGNDGAVSVKELPGEEADVPAASHHAPSFEQTTRTGRPQELHVQVRRRGIVTRIKPGYQAGPSVPSSIAARKPP